MESLENLPNELQRNFGNMRELDQRSQDIMKNVDQLADDYLLNVRVWSPEKRTEQMSNVQKLFNRVKEYSDDKVQLAIQTYELVDKHIRRLDADLAKFEAELKEKAMNKQQKEEEVGKSKKRKKKAQAGTEKATKASKLNTKKKANSDDDDVPKGGRKKKKKEVVASGGTMLSVLSKLPGIAHPSDVLDMPVDPNEPTYCLCHQVSYGEMIACDKTDCPIEWFHFACVGLTTKPKGRWYCPKCTTERKKK